MFDHAVILPTNLDKYRGGPNYRLNVKYVDTQGFALFGNEGDSMYIWAKRVPLTLNYIDTRLSPGRQYLREIMSSITDWGWVR